MYKVPWIILLLFAHFWNINCQSDSLRSALDEIERRQRELPEDEYGYTLSHPDDIAFLKAYAPEENYIEKAARYGTEKYNKRLSSAFRERVEEDHEKQLEERAQNLISNLDRNGRYTDEDYEELLRELWEKYRRPIENSNIYSPTINKRIYYPRFGLDSVGPRKRNPYDDDQLDDPYNTNQEVVGDYDLDESDSENDITSNNYLRKRYLRGNRMNRQRQLYIPMYPYTQMKRFPVTKRSSDYLMESRDVIQEKKRSAASQNTQTDPKVEKELSDIFGNRNNESITSKPEVVKPTAVKKSTNETKAPKKNQRKANTKEEYSPVALVAQKPLQIKKKSIDWSDYFGLDRRKKSSSDDVDKEWLIERYHKSIALTNKKRNAELPLSSFRQHDGLVKKENNAHNNSGKNLPEDKKLDEIDSKLQVMEDKIVDDTLKFTGSHEGETDPKEIQEVKDKIIARLAAAYNLEKMRNALGEYRMAVARERERLTNNRKPEDDDDYLFEDKRTAIPRKQVVEDNVAEADNNIKCTEGDEDCHEQSYRTPSEIVENHMNTDECPAIERACNNVATIVGQYGHLFRQACTTHQMCLICSNNSWFTPTRQCNALYLAKAFDLCKDNALCQKEAQRSIRYLLDVNRSLHAQSNDINDCELACPESDMPFDLTVR